DYDSRAEYLVALGSQVHVGASFTAHAVPELRRAGFEVEIDPSYPFRVVEPEPPWDAWLEPSEKTAWFRVGLGIEIDGRPYDLVPALLELLESSAEGTTWAELARCPARFRAIPLGDGRFVVLPWERLRRVLEVLAELHPSGSGELRLPQNFLFDLLALDEAFKVEGGELRFPGADELRERARRLATGPGFSPRPAALRAELRPYQHEGLMWLEHLRDAGVGGVLADDMGLGKTLQTIALLAREKEARRMDQPTLIVTPTSLIGNWLRELEKFAPHLRVRDYTGHKRSRIYDELPRADVVITSYPILLRDLQRLECIDYHYVILDEAQAIKNPRSQAGGAVRRLNSRHRLALSGTPVENNLEELWSLFDFVVPGLLGSAERFRRGFRDPIEQRGDTERLEQLRLRVAPFILRRLKESVARDLPAKTELIRSVDLTGAQRDLYESIRLAADADVRRAVSARGIAGSAVAILDALMKLRQVCCDPRLVRVEAARLVTESAKYDAFFELLEPQLAAGRRVLVFSQFTGMLQLLRAGLNERGVDSLLLTGQSQDRQKLVDAFEAGEAPVFFISLKAGGTGLNLVSADTVIHYDPWWNAAAQMQATDRAYRIGQKKPVFVYNLITSSSVEERMLGLQRRKRLLADTLLGQGAGAPLGLSEDDLDDLFAPLDRDDALGTSSLPPPVR
ncbi:MAG TPA: DEAD/DEAH box helicase, partial [Polyangiaceae bacterium]|nr:DEAD/DEAH box helicase [Polyangiaceae bacterium]